MCLDIDRSKHPCGCCLIAREDITVYKAGYVHELYKDCFAPFFHPKYCYSKNVVCEKIDLFPSKTIYTYNYEITSEGFHSCLTIRDAFVIYYGYNFYKIDKNCFEARVKDCYNDEFTLMRIGKFIIPKGSKYYLGIDNDICSDKIIFIDFLSKEEHLIYPEKEGE